MARRPKPSKAELINRAIERWEQKQDAAVIMLRKSAEELQRLRRQRRRMLEASTKQALAKRHEETVTQPESQSPPPPPTPSANGDGLDIPAFMRRGMETQAKVDAILDEESKRLAALPDPRSKEKKAERREVEREVRQAEITGKRRRMPPSGKDALRAIRESK